jgi:hypothetical protein
MSINKNNVAVLEIVSGVNQRTYEVSLDEPVSAEMLTWEFETEEKARRFALELRDLILNHTNHEVSGAPRSPPIRINA